MERTKEQLSFLLRSLEERIRALKEELEEVPREAWKAESLVGTSFFKLYSKYKDLVEQYLKATEEWYFLSDKEYKGAVFAKAKYRERKMKEEDKRKEYWLQDGERKWSDFMEKIKSCST